MPKKQPIVITYNGVDGACAAAVACHGLREPLILVSSARRIASTLAGISRHAPHEIHICGLGIHCSWQELEEAALPLKRQGTAVFWYCGRGYLDERRAGLDTLCTPVLLSTGTNAACVARHFGLLENLDVQRLMDLAWQDEHITGPKPPVSTGESTNFWIDFIHSSMSQYFKFQDVQPYLDAIVKLAHSRTDADDRARVDLFRRTGYKYLLQGQTEALQKLKRRVQKCADADRHVLVTGESGVGKELVANLLWERSSRATGPLVAINCAHYAGNAGLANSDLFGHKKGSFTGADRDRRGKLTEADGGILYLDELGELPLEVQAKLLRVLEDGKVMPEGADTVERVVDLRVLAATNRDLPALIRSGGFRADLYHRLSTLTIEVPPLRERPADIVLIARQRLEALRQEGYEFTLKARDQTALEAYHWPGNVRQLIKVVERAVLLELSIDAVLQEERDLSLDSHDNHPWPARREALLSMEALQSRYAAHAFNLCSGQVGLTAEALQISPNTLRKYLRTRDT
jgi:DNA-binding NtrC family response regulator